MLSFLFLVLGLARKCGVCVRRSSSLKDWADKRCVGCEAYTNEEKTNRGFFLERLGQVYHEENKTDQSIAAYQKMIDMGGDTGLRGLEAQVEVYSVRILA